MAPPSPESPVGPELRRSTRVSIPPPYLTDYHFSFALSTLYKPHTYREAHIEPLWQQVINEELDALHKNNTWDMVDLPPGQSVVGCRWVYKIKTKTKGFTQEYGIDYDETFAPVAHLTSVRCLIAMAAVYRWPLYQIDVKNAFLNGDLHKEVYMQPPPGYPHSGNQVCRLRRALYGLKQAPRVWFEKFSSVVAQQGFTSSPQTLLCLSEDPLLVSLLFFFILMI